MSYVKHLYKTYTIEEGEDLFDLIESKQDANIFIVICNLHLVSRDSSLWKRLRKQARNLSKSLI